MLVHVRKDGTRIVVAPKSEPAKAKAARTFAEARDEAEYALGALGLHPHVLLQMQRRITWKRKRYGPQGA